METTENKLVFIVDDDPVYTKLIHEYLIREVPDVQIKTFPTGEACLHEMFQNPIAIVLDYYLDSEFPYAWTGEQILKKIELSFPSTSVIIISAQESMEVALNCVKQGAREYVIKNEKALSQIKKVLLDIIDDATVY